MKLNIQKRMNFKAHMLVLTALLFIAAGCSDNDTPQNPDIEGSDTKVETQVTVKLTSSSAQSRAEGVAASETLAFDGGHMYFTSKNGVITKYFAISDLDTDIYADPAGTNIKLADLQKDEGLELVGIPANSDSVFIIGNIPELNGLGDVITIPTEVGTHIREVQSIRIAVEDQNNDAGNTDNVTVYGGGGIVDFAPPVANKKQVEIRVAPLSGRIEIAKITYEGEEIRNYSVEAVFINNYYSYMWLDRHVDTEDVYIKNEDKLPNYEKYLDTEPLGEIAERYKKTKLYDWYSAPLSSSGNITSPHADNPSKQWSYNVLAPFAFKDGTPQYPECPHIIVRLTNIETRNDSEYGNVYEIPMYLTMRMKTAGTDYPITTFEPGTVYQIENIAFTDGNLYERPEMTVIDVQVTIKLVDWTLKATEVLLN